MDTLNQNNNSERKVGPIIGTLIIVLLLVVAALYFWGNRLNKEQVEDVTATPMSAAAVNSTSSATGTKSDDIDSLLEEVNTSSEVSTDTTI